MGILKSLNPLNQYLLYALLAAIVALVGSITYNVHLLKASGKLEQQIVQLEQTNKDQKELVGKIQQTGEDYVESNIALQKKWQETEANFSSVQAKLKAMSKKTCNGALNEPTVEASTSEWLNAAVPADVNSLRIEALCLAKGGSDCSSSDQ